MIAATLPLPAPLSPRPTRMGIGLPTTRVGQSRIQRRLECLHKTCSPQKRERRTVATRMKAAHQAMTQATGAWRVRQHESAAPEEPRRSCGLADVAVARADLFRFQNMKLRSQ